MSRDLSEINSDYFQDLTENDYYKKIQKQLKDKHLKRKESEKGKVPDTEQAAKRVSEVAGTKKASDASRLMNTTDKAQIRSLSWEKNTEGKFEIQPEPETEVISAVPKEDAKRIRRLLGIKIDFSERQNQLQDQYMQSVIQARSHNFFLSKYAMFKVGMLGQLLSMIGVSQQELEKFKKKAIEGAIEENISLMEENIYNQELVDLVKGRNRKTRRSQRQFKELENQLKQQMSLLGKEEYWSDLRLLEEQVVQCQRIHEEFNNEKKALEYQLNIKGQDVIINEQRNEPRID